MKNTSTELLGRRVEISMSRESYLEHGVKALHGEIIHCIPRTIRRPLPHFVVLLDRHPQVVSEDSKLVSSSIQAETRTVLIRPFNIGHEIERLIKFPVRQGNGCRVAIQ